jgi:hypothetical protein
MTKFTFLLQIVAKVSQVKSSDFLTVFKKKYICLIQWLHHFYNSLCLECYVQVSASVFIEGSDCAVQ